ncbi:FMN-dependent NADH-azoreductase [Alkalimarinus alittae]|uniref:FMN dependent NADH:quinone oxidoreductase n=1 Tax=Alkalimarinus alittae TaxID=2961619 RepID=A0ABY6N2D8_9ALTE|nr:FMN-dependent NADH-azoreductase [Alkalimarinus alittae]UZE96219.1 FMN-dependent NADH-azoreductase [Alkalimarinus alittae]
MNTLLRLDTSLFSGQGVSTQLSDDLLNQIKKNNSELTIIHRNFAQQPIPHLDGDWLQALMTPDEKRSVEQQQKVEFSDQLIEELRSADTIIIGLPMYNFSIPSMLKAWFDHVARAGTTFKYTTSGPEGLLTDKKVYLVTTRGGIHKDQPSDTQMPFVKIFLAFLGLTNVETIYAEGLNMGDEVRDAAIVSAKQSIEALAFA